MPNRVMFVVVSCPESFSLEQMRQNLRDLERYVASWAAEPPAKSIEKAENPE
jgi:hypothetical protein